MKFVFGVAVTVLLLGWAFRDAAPASIWGTMKTADVHWLALSLVAFLSSFAVRALRWGTLLGEQSGAGFSLRHSATFIGFAGNYILPARLGEIVRATVLNQHSNVPFPTALASIFVERALDAAIILMLLAISYPAAAASSRLGLRDLHLGIGAVLLIVGFAALYRIVRRPEKLTRGLDRVAALSRFVRSRYAQLRNWAELLMNGADVFHSPKRVAKAMAEGLVLWGLVGAAYLFCMYSFGITTPGFLGALFVSSIAALGIAIPSTPGHFGPFEAAVRIALGLYAIPADVVLAYALTLHALMFLSVTSIGLTLAVPLGLSWSKFTRTMHTPKRKESP